MEPRKSVVINVEDFSAITVMKPFSDGYNNHWIVIFEDAYGEMRANLVAKDELQKTFGLSDSQFEKIKSSL